MSRARRLADVLRDAPGLGRWQVTGDADVVVSGITHDSRAVVPGELFACVPGASADGHRFAGDAVARGAVAVLCERPVDVEVSQVMVSSVRDALGPLAAAVFGHPARQLELVGVTGTNGKTTTTQLLASVLRAAGRQVATIGTLSGSRTTPEATDLQRRLAELVDEGTNAVAMEVTSHGLALHRVDGTHFDVAVFTNLTQDHLDFHGTMERYFAAKAHLFDPELTDHAVVNADDAHGRLLRDAALVPTVTYSMSDAQHLEQRPLSSRFVWRGSTVELGLGGRFNVSNALAAATAASLLGIDVPTIAAGLSASGPVPGRYEPVDAGQPFTVVVDYAHTPDALEELIATARATAGGRVIVVFGCGGERDATKRPAMGEVAARRADLAVITSDNPRSEEPGDIIAAILSGVPAAARSRVVVEADRRAAIALALSHAAAGDQVLIAGKGHEVTQTIGATVVDFDDRVVAKELLEAAR